MSFRLFICLALMGLPYLSSGQLPSASNISSISGEFLFPRGEAMLNPNFINQRYLIPMYIPMEQFVYFNHNSTGQMLNEGLGINLRFHYKKSETSKWQTHFMIGYRWGEHYGWNATTAHVVSGDTTTFDQWRIMENWDEFRIGRGVQRFYPLGESRFSFGFGYTFSLGVPVLKNEVIVTRNQIQRITTTDSTGIQQTRYTPFDEERSVLGKMRFTTLTHEIPLELHYRLSDNWSITAMMRHGLQHYISRPDIGLIVKSNFFSQPAFGIRYNFGH